MRSVGACLVTSGTSEDWNLSNSTDDLRKAANAMAKDFAKLAQKHGPALRAGAREVLEKDLPRARKMLQKEFPKMADAVQKELPKVADAVRAELRKRRGR